MSKSMDPSERPAVLKRGDWLLALGAVICVALVLGNTWAGVTALEDFQEHTSRVARSHEVEKNLQTMLALATDAETGQRGFLLTGEEPYLAPYEEAFSKLEQQVDKVAELTADSDAQQARIPVIRRRVQDKLKELALTIDLYRQGNVAEAMSEVRSDRGQRDMAALRALVEDMTATESERLNQLEASARETYRKAISTMLVGGCAAAAALGLITWLMRRRTQQASTAAAMIADREERLQITVDSIGDGVIAVDAEGKVSNMNPVAERLTGWEAHEAVGKPIERVFRIVNEDTRKPVTNPALAALEHRQAVPVDNHTVLISKSGEERAVGSSASPIRSFDKRVIGSVLVARDVSQRRVWEDRLRKSEEDLRRALEHAPVPVVIHTEDGDILQVSQTWNEKSGCPCPPNRRLPEWLLDAYQRELPQGCGPGLADGMRSFELTFDPGDGRQRTWSYNASSPSVMADGRRVVVGIADDVTDRVQLTSKLERARESAESASRSRGQFLANMSHEIRTPMTAILGHADILREHLRDPDNLQSVDTIASNGQYLLQIINDILDLSKIDAGRTEIERTDVKPHQLFADIQSLLSVSAGDKDLAFSITCEGLIPETIETDPIRLRQILVNLIGNAIKFTDTGYVRVTVRYLEPSNTLVITVKDTGIGMEADSLAHIFEPFVQADGSSTRTREGSGLGLAICRRLAEALGGNIKVSSQVGRGSSFELTIDCGDVTDVDLIHATLFVKQVGEAEPPTRTTLDCTVLVVDDRRDIRFLVRRFVEKAQGKVIEATNGQEAFDMIVGDAAIAPSIDLVVMDMQMPVLDGYEATRKLREHGSKLPIIALTANAMVEDRERCLSAGCDDYCSKPIDGGLLISKIHELTVGTADV